MPVATPIAGALGEAPALERVVEAVASVAEALASLAAEGISHRDVKPGNLYHFEGQWMIGDFGLVSYPGKEPITEEGKKLGPLYFLSPEMLSNPATAKGELSDVYSLAKTLWVLATGQNYPPQGEQRVDVEQLTISGNVVHTRAYLLDRLLERATRHDPATRPSMAGMASELRAG
jgi:serine/threonine protein kinase